MPSKPTASVILTESAIAVPSGDLLGAPSMLASGGAPLTLKGVESAVVAVPSETTTVSR